jgi:hypothetical protein
MFEESTTMQTHSATPPSFVIFAMAGGLLFILGGIITAMSPNARAILIASAIAFLLLGIYAIAVAVRHNRMVEEVEAMSAELAEARSIDAGLRVRLGYTLRDPLTTVVGLADRMLQEPDIPLDERRSMLAEVRNNAREVEHILGDLAAEERLPASHPHAEGLVLLDEEMRSIVSTINIRQTFGTDLRPARAWGDSALVRQILRTVIGSVVDAPCERLEVATEQRGGRAIATISGRGELLPIEAVAALTGNIQSTDAEHPTHIALREAHDVASSMGATVGYAEALGRSHIVVEFEAAPESPGGHGTVTSVMATPLDDPGDAGHDTFHLSFASTVDLRPERPTSAIRFS